MKKATEVDIKDRFEAKLSDNRHPIINPKNLLPVISHFHR